MTNIAPSSHQDWWLTEPSQSTPSDRAMTARAAVALTVSSPVGQLFDKHQISLSVASRYAVGDSTHLGEKGDQKPMVLLPRLSASQDLISFRRISAERSILAPADSGAEPIGAPSMFGAHLTEGLRPSDSIWVVPGEMNAVAVAHTNLPNYGPALSLSAEPGRLEELLSIKALLQEKRVGAIHAFVGDLNQANRISGVLRHYGGPSFDFTFSFIPVINDERVELTTVLAMNGVEGLQMFLEGVVQFGSFLDCSDRPADLPADVITWDQLHPTGTTEEQLRAELEVQYLKVRQLGFSACQRCIQEGIQALEGSMEQYRDWHSSYRQLER